MQNRSSIIPAKSITIDGISIYYSEGELRMRKAAGPTKKQVRTKASCAPIRENNTEFGCASKLSKDLRLHIGLQLRDFADSYISARFTGLFRRVIAKGEGERGMRVFNPCQQQHLLRGFECNRHRSFRDAWKSAVTFSLRDNSSEYVLHTIVPTSVSEAPVGATHVCLALFAASVPEMQYDTSRKLYRNADTASSCFNEKASSSSEKICLHTGVSVSIELRVPIQHKKSPENNMAVLVFAGVTYYCGDTLLKEGAAMQLGAVIV